MAMQLQRDRSGGSMSKLKYIVPAVVAFGGVLFSSAVTYGKPEYTKKEKKACVYCHTKANSKELNDVGKCYSQKKSLDGCSTEKK
jgi:hypothetical protein